MNCDALKKLISEYLNDSLDATQQAEFETHLAQCTECQAEFSALESTWNALGALPDENPAADSKFRFAAMLNGYVQGEKNSKPVWSFRERWREWWQPAFQFAVAIICLLVGFGLGRLHQQEAAELAQLKQEVTEMRQAMLLSRLHQSSSLTRLSGIRLTRQLSEPGPKIISVLLETIETDPNVNVRLAAIDALAYFKTLPQVDPELVEALPRQNSPLVQIAMINFLIARSHHDALPVFQRMIQQNALNPAVKSHLQWGIQQLI